MLRPSSAGEKAVPGAKKRIAAEIAALAKKREESKLVRTKFRIGEYEWCEPDYRQLLIWADALALKPREVIERLQQGKKSSYVPWGRERGKPKEYVWAESVSSNGKLIKLNWDFELLPLKQFDCISGLEITHLSIRSPQNEWHSPSAADFNKPQFIESLKLQLPSLTHLSCERLGLSELDLSRIPKLTELLCGQNSLKEMNFSAVSALEKLRCGINEFAELNLTTLVHLTELDCSFSSGNWGDSTEVLLSTMPGLLKLDCSANEFSMVTAFLSHAPHLKELWCDLTGLESIDLSGVPELKKLTCGHNAITDLDLSPVPGLEELNCRVMKLTKLDLSHTPRLIKLDCRLNDFPSLDIRPPFQLRKLMCNGQGNAEFVRKNVIQRPDQHF